MQECRDESEIYNYQRIQLSNNKFINVILGVMLDLTVTHYKGKKVSTKDKNEPQHILKGKYYSKLGQSPLRELHFRSNKKKLQVRKQIHTERVHSS